MALFVAGVVCLSQAIPVFADDVNKVLVSFESGSGQEIYIVTENTMYFTEDSYTYNDIVVPVYLRFKNNYNLGYFSGYVTATITPFNYVDGNSNRLVINYFEDNVDNIFIDYVKTSGSFLLTFDNAHIRSNVDIPIGYFHLMTNNNITGSLTITCNNRTQMATIGSNQLYETAYEYGYVNAMIYALNNSANVEEMLTILNSIDANMLPEILTVMRSNHTALYNLIQNVWTTDQAVLSVNRDIYNNVLSILAILEDQYVSQASNVEDIKDHVQQELNTARQDMELTKPSQVADLADDYIDQIDTQYNYSVFSWLTAPTFILMMCIVAALAIISYMLYGGQ